MPYPHCEHVERCKIRRSVSLRGLEKGLNYSRAEEISWSSGRDTSTDTLSTICYVYRAHECIMQGVS